MIPRFLRPERVPYASVEIVQVETICPDSETICAYCPDFNRADPANRHASHGICPACLARFEAGVQ